jgi:hypothetical protein
MLFMAKNKHNSGDKGMCDFTGCHLSKEHNTTNVPRKTEKTTEPYNVSTIAIPRLSSRFVLLVVFMFTIFTRVMSLSVSINLGWLSSLIIAMDYAYRFSFGVFPLYLIDENG